MQDLSILEDLAVLVIVAFSVAKAGLEVLLYVLKGLIFAVVDALLDDIERNRGFDDLVVVGVLAL